MNLPVSLPELLNVIQKEVIMCEPVATSLTNVKTFGSLALVDTQHVVIQDGLKRMDRLISENFFVSNKNGKA